MRNVFNGKLNTLQVYVGKRPHNFKEIKKRWTEVRAQVHFSGLQISRKRTNI